MNAADIMTSKVITVLPETTVGEIAETLLANRISAVPVVDKADNLLGIVSEGDLIHRVESGTERRRSWWLVLLAAKPILAQEFVKSHARKAADLMTHPVITAKPDTPLSELASLLEKHHIKRVPVVNDGKMVGIVSRANLLQALVRRDHELTSYQTVDDSTLRSNVLTRLRSHPWWPSDVNVVVRDGTVELWGIVQSEVEKDAIRIAVEEIDGVQRISNNLSVSDHLQDGM